jgi:hypothetical protein
VVVVVDGAFRRQGNEGAVIRHYFVIISGLVQYLSLYLSYKAEFIEF